MEEELQSLTDQLDALISEMGEGGERPEGIYSAVEQFKTAIQEGSEDLKEAVDDIGGGAEVSNAEEGIEEQADRILPDEEFSPEQVLAQELAIEEGLEVEDTIGEEAVDAVESSLETDAAQIGEGFQQIAEDAETLNDVFVALGESSAVSNEALQELQPTFEELQTEVQETIQEVESGAATLSEGQNRIAEISQKAQEALQENIEGQFENVEGVGQELQEVVSKYFENVQTQMGAAGAAEQAGVPGVEQTLAVGGTLQELGDGNVFQGIASAVDTALAPITNPDFQGFNAAMQEAQEEAGGIAAMFSKVKGAISASRVALGAFIVAVDLVEDAFGAARDFREETGIGAERMRELREVTASTSAELAEFGLDPGAAGEILGGLREEFGSVQTAIARTGTTTKEQLTTQVGALAEGFALSGSEAATLQSNLTRIEESTGISSQQLAQQTRELARAKKVAPQAAIQDIAKNSSQVAKFSGQSASKLAEAAVEAQRLGTSIEAVSEFQEGVLTDITGTVQGLQEASMLTGQQLNSTALIEASYQGQGEALDELQNQLQGIDLENLNPFARMSLEEAIPGMNFEEIQGIVEGRRELDRLNTQAERTQALMEGDVSFEQVITEGSVDQVSELTRTFNALYFVLAEELFPVVTDLTQAVLPALTATLEAANPILQGFARGVRLILSPIQALAAGVQYLAGNTDKAKSSWESFGSSLMAVASPFNNLLTLVGGGSEKAKELNSTASVLIETVKAAGVAIGTYLGGSYIASAVSGLYSLVGGVSALGTAFSLTGIGTIITAIAAAITGATVAFNNWNSIVETTMPYINAVSDFFSGLWEHLITVDEQTTHLKASFVSFNDVMSLVEGAIWAVGESIPYLVSGFKTLVSWGGSVAEALQLDHVFGAIGSGIQYVVGFIERMASLGKKIYSSESAMNALKNSLYEAVEPMKIMLDPILDAISYVKELTELFYDLGSAIFQGKFQNLDDILLEGLGDVASSFVDLIIPFNLEEMFAGRMESITATIRSYLPFSPAEEGPLADLDMVGEALIDTIFGDGVFSFAAQKMKELGSTVMDTLSSMGEGVMNFLGLGGGEEESKSKEKSASEMMLESAMITVQNATIQGISGQEGEAAQVNVQSPNVATVDSDVATGPQRAAATSAPAQQPQQQQGETNEIRLDSSEDNVKQILRQILNTQKKFLKQLQNGNIAVYLDGRKVNKEIVRSTGFAN